MAGFDNDVMYADNVDFRGVEPVVGTVTQEADLMIGTGSDPAIKIGQLTSTDNSVTISYNEPNINLAVSAASSKEFFVFCYNPGSWEETYQPFLTQTIDTNLYAFHPFRVPFDFNSIVAAYLIIMGSDEEGTLTYDIAAGIASVGEAYNADNRSSNGNTVAVTEGIIAELDITSFLSGLVAGDNVCVTITTQDLKFQAYGLRFRYQ